MSRKIIDLSPDAKAKFLVFSGLMAEAGLPFILTCTLRTIPEHETLRAQGRESLAIVNEMRSNIGLAPITEKQNVEVTWTKNSRHFADETGKSNAWDIAICKGKMPIWNIKCNVNENEQNDYEEAAVIGRKVGLTCGADFSKKDYVHFELKKEI